MGVPPLGRCTPRRPSRFPTPNRNHRTPRRRARAQPARTGTFAGCGEGSSALRVTAGLRIRGACRVWAPMDPREDEKRAAAEAAALEVQAGTTLGLGTGSTVAHFLPALARRNLDVMCVATSVATEGMAHNLGLATQPFDLLERLDMAVDG